MNDDDFPLLRFDFTPPPCEVIVFPVDKRVGKARHIATKLMAMEQPGKEKAKASYWNERCKDMAVEMRKYGLSDDQVKSELAAFGELVTLEMKKAKAKANQSPKPPGWNDGGPRIA